MPRHATMYDVADLAGVAQSTVSYVINNKADQLHISKETQRRVMESVRKLNYRASVGARSIRKVGSGCWGVLSASPTSGTPLSGEQLSGINRASLDYDRHLIYVELDEQRVGDADYLPKMIREHLVDGMIVPRASRLTEVLREAINRCDLPVIWIQEQRETDAVWVDESFYGREATEYLLKLGHSRIGYVNFAGTGSFWAKARRRGYEEVMAEAQLAPMVIDEAVRRKDRATIIEELLKRPDRPTALLLHGLSAAIPFAFVALRLGIRIPQDLSLILVSDPGTPDQFLPTLTYWDNREEQLGYHAATMLKRKIDQKGRPQKGLACRGRLVEGESTCPPQS